MMPMLDGTDEYISFLSEHDLLRYKSIRYNTEINENAYETQYFYDKVIYHLSRI